MGEKVAFKGDDGEKKKKAEGGQEAKKDDGGEKKKDKGGEKKKDDGPITVVLKVDMHCEGCARKVKHSVKGFEGVEAVAADCANNKLTVVGNVDPWKLRDRVESKTRKQVVLVSPTNLPKRDPVVKDEKKKDEKKTDEKKTDEKKPKEPAASTVVLKIRLHCEGCIHRIRRTITKMKGVETVAIDPKEDLVTVRGTMDVKALPDYLKDRLKRSVAVVAGKKDDGGGNKKEKGDKGGGDKKKGGAGDGGAEKKGKEDGGGGEGEKRKGDGGAKVVPEANRMEYGVYGGGFGGYPPYLPYNYRYETVHAPQLFSDENPNACSIM